MPAVSTMKPQKISACMGPATGSRRSSLEDRDREDVLEAGARVVEARVGLAKAQVRISRCALFAKNSVAASTTMVKTTLSARMGRS